MEPMLDTASMHASFLVIPRAQRRSEATAAQESLFNETRSFVSFEMLFKFSYNLRQKFAAQMAISCFASPLSFSSGLLLGHLISYFVLFRCLPPNDRIQLLIINGTDAILDPLIRSASLTMQPPHPTPFVWYIRIQYTNVYGKYRTVYAYVAQTDSTSFSFASFVVRSPDIS